MTELRIYAEIKQTWVSGVLNLEISYQPAIRGLVQAIPSGIPIVRNATIDTIEDADHDVFTDPEQAALWYFWDGPDDLGNVIVGYVNTYVGSAIYERGSMIHVFADVDDLLDNVASIANSAAAAVETVTDGLASLNIALSEHNDDNNAAFAAIDTSMDDKADKATTINGHDLSNDITITKGDVSMGNVDNTSDADKPISTATATALAGKATPADITNAIDAVVNGAGTAFNTLKELQDLLQADETIATSLATTVGGKVDKTTTVNGHALSGNVTVTKSDVSLGNVDNTADASKSFTASQISDFAATVRGIALTGLSTSTNVAIATGDTILAALGKLQAQITDILGRLGRAVQGITGRLNAFPIFKSVSVGSGVAVFHLTSDGTSGGTALFPTGPITESVNAFVSDATASYQMGYAWSNSNKTLTITTNKLTTSNILTGILGQAAANTATVYLQVWGY